MDKLAEKPLNSRKKISLNVNNTILDLVKDLAKLTKTNNTIIIESLLVAGISPLFKQFKTGWVTLLGDAKDAKRKAILKTLLKKLETISEKKEYHALMKA